MGGRKLCPYCDTQMAKKNVETFGWLLVCGTCKFWVGVKEWTEFEAKAKAVE